ncbi:MAG: DDE-type integrase/transposase/recombinase [Actinomycetia bacterium]|nr:DDE-type integrase/transposase/recombinase [Actinomycetes bacterium]
MVHVDVKKVGRIPDGGGWRVHGKGSPQAKAVASATNAGARAGYVYLHTAIDGFSRLAYTETLPNEKAITAIRFIDCARVWFAVHGINYIQRIVTDHGSCYRAEDFARCRMAPFTSRSPPTPHVTTATWRDTIESWPKNSTTRASGPQKPSEPRRSKSGTSPSTAIDHSRREPTASLTTLHRRHQRHGPIQLAVASGLWK